MWRTPSGTGSVWALAACVALAACGGSGGKTTVAAGGAGGDAGHDAGGGAGSGGAGRDAGAGTGGSGMPDGSAQEHAPPAPIGVGDACFFDADCPGGGPCVLFCSKGCTTDADCAGSHAGGRNAQGVQNRCVQTLDPISGTMSLTCFPGCNGQSDCNPLGLICRAGPGAGNTTVMVCTMQ
jgi:hypothetical protein